MNALKNINTKINAFNYYTMARSFTWYLRRTFLLTNRSSVYQKPVSILKANDYAIQSRYVANFCTNQINIDYDEPKGFNEFAKDIKSSRSEAIPTLMKILSVTRQNAKKAVEMYPNFKLLSKKTIYMNFQVLREAGFYKSTIKDNKYLLDDDTAILKKKINSIQQIDVDINDTAPLFHLSDIELAFFEKQSKMDAIYLPVPNRLVYLAEKLQCNVAKICEMMIYNPNVWKLPAPKLLTVTEYVLEAGIAPEHILSDTHIYDYQISTLMFKIERAKKAGITPLRPWVLRCQEAVWKRLEGKHAEREAILKPGQSVAEHLREILDCDMESLNFVLSKYPRILTMDLERLTAISKFLHDEGYKIEDVQRQPAFMHLRYESIQERYTAWKKLCNKRPPLCAFTMSKEDFKKRLATLCCDN